MHDNMKYFFFYYYLLIQCYHNYKNDSHTVHLNKENGPWHHISIVILGHLHASTTTLEAHHKFTEVVGPNHESTNALEPHPAATIEYWPNHTST